MLTTRKKSAQLNELDFAKPLYVYNFKEISNHLSSLKQFSTKSELIIINEYRLASIVYQLLQFIEVIFHLFYSTVLKY